MNTNFNILIEYLPFIVPLLILQGTLALVSLVHVLRHSGYRFGNRIFWCVVVVFVQFLGPVIYFMWGRGEE